jgi:hypothetical protein
MVQRDFAEGLDGVARTPNPATHQAPGPGPRSPRRIAVAPSHRVQLVEPLSRAAIADMVYLCPDQRGSRWGVSNCIPGVDQRVEQFAIH